MGYPRDIVPQTEIDGLKINFKRTDKMINNFNPVMVTCFLSNHDVKFVPSGKDGKNIAFYVTNYATKSQISSHNMVPLIAASKKIIDEDPSISSGSVCQKAKAMITKCLNKVSTDTEVSGAHACHFLLGYNDNKTSHKFTALNLHCALGWLTNAIQDYDNIDPLDEESSDQSNENDDDDE